VDKVLDHAGTIVIGNAAPEFREVPRRLRESQSIVDLVRVSEARSVAGVYEGICW
jgi:GDP-mannose 6-dehydrogenase